MGTGRARSWGIVAIGAAIVLLLLLAWMSGARTSRATRPPAGPAPERERAEPPLVAAAPEADDGAREALGKPVGSASIFGRIGGADGEPVSGARVVLHDAHGGSQPVSVTGERHRADGLAPGDWWLAVYPAVQRSAVVRVQGLAAGEERRVDVVLEPHTALEILEIVAVDGEGEPLRPVRLGGSDFLQAQRVAKLVPVASHVAIGAHFPFDVGGTSRAGAGSFVPRGGTDPPELLGHIVLDAELPLHVALTCYQGVLAEELVLPGTTRVTFALDEDALARRLAGLSFRLVDAHGAPAAADVLASPRLWAPGAFEVALPLPGGAGASSTIPSLPPGEYALLWTERSLRRSFTLVAGETLDLGAIPTGDVRELRGRVQLADGTAPVLPDDGQEFPRFAFGQAGPWKGAVVLDDTWRLQAGTVEEIRMPLQADVYTLQWRCGRFATQPFVVDLTTGTPELELTAHALAPLVLEPPDDPAAFGVRIFDVRGVELERLAFVSRWPLRLELVPGVVRVVVADAGGRTLSERSVVLEPGGTRVALGR